MLDILMSVHQEWIVKMASGEKTDELRKTWPKNIPTPFRVRLYCTRGRGPETLLLDGKGGAVIGDYRNVANGWQIGNGYVVGEFICPGRTIVKAGFDRDLVAIGRTTCLAPSSIISYIGEGHHGSAWHIRDLKIYDKPIELDRFFMPAERDGAWLCRVERAPQSWCYIEQIVKGTFASAAGGRGSEQKGVAAVAEADRVNARERRCGNGNRRWDDGKNVRDV